MSLLFATICLACLLLVGLNILFYSATRLAFHLASKVLLRMSLPSRERTLLAGIFLPSLFAICLTAYSVWTALTCEDVAKESFVIGPCVHLARHLCLHLDYARLQITAVIQWSEVLCAGLLVALCGLVFWLRRHSSSKWRSMSVSAKLRRATKRTATSGGARVRVVEVSDCPSGAALMGWLSPRCVIASWLVRRASSLELQVALKHEFAHARRGDNAKRLLMRSCKLLSLCFPATNSLCEQWEQTAELICDAAASENRHEALALASVLVKVLSRDAAGSAAAYATLVSHNGSAAMTRIERLLQYRKDCRRTHALHEFAVQSGLAVLLGTLSVLCATTLHCMAETLLRLPSIF